MDKNIINQEIGESINYAAQFLPRGYVLSLNIEKHGYGLSLACDGMPLDLQGDEDSIPDEIKYYVAEAQKHLRADIAIEEGRTNHEPT